MSIRSIERAGTSFHVVIDDALTPDDAIHIRDAVCRQITGSVVMVDVRWAHDCSPQALLTLSGLCSQTGAPLLFAGLSGANERLLQYLRVDHGPARGP